MWPALEHQNICPNKGRGTTSEIDGDGGVSTLDLSVLNLFWLLWPAPEQQISTQGVCGRGMLVAGLAMRH